MPKEAPQPRKRRLSRSSKDRPPPPNDPTGSAYSQSSRSAGERVFLPYLPPTLPPGTPPFQPGTQVNIPGMPPLVATEPFPLPPGVLFPPSPSPPPPQRHVLYVPSHQGSSLVFLPVPVPMPLPMPPPSPQQAPTIIACPPTPVQYSYPPPPPPPQPLSPSEDFARLIMLLERFGPESWGGGQREEFESDMDRRNSRKKEKREKKTERKKRKKERAEETKRGNGQDDNKPGVVLKQMQGDDQPEDTKKEELEEANKDSKGAHDLNASVPGPASQAADMKPGAPVGEAQPLMSWQENGEPALPGAASENIGSSLASPPQLGEQDSENAGRCKFLVSHRCIVLVVLGISLPIILYFVYSLLGGTSQKRRIPGKTRLLSTTQVVGWTRHESLL